MDHSSQPSSVSPNTQNPHCDADQLNPSDNSDLPGGAKPSVESVPPSNPIALIQAMAHLAELASINTIVSTHGWSVVCPNQDPCYSIPEIIAAGADMRTVDYIYPLSQFMPIRTPPTCIINIFTQHPDIPGLYIANVVLFTCSGSPQESRITLEGLATMRDGLTGGLVVSGHCKVVPESGTGIFAGITGGSASFKNFWGVRITHPAPEGSELADPNFRLSPVQWSFLLTSDVAGALNLALSRSPA